MFLYILQSYAFLMVSDFEKRNNVTLSGFSISYSLICLFPLIFLFFKQQQNFFGLYQAESKNKHSAKA